MEEAALLVQALLHCTGGGPETIEAPIKSFWWNWLLLRRETLEVLMVLSFIGCQAARWIPSKEALHEIKTFLGGFRVKGAQGDSVTSRAHSPNEAVGIGLLGQPIELVV